MLHNIFQETNQKEKRMKTLLTSTLLLISLNCFAGSTPYNKAANRILDCQESLEYIQSYDDIEVKGCGKSVVYKDGSLFNKCLSSKICVEWNENEVCIKLEILCD